MIDSEDVIWARVRTTRAFVDAPADQGSRRRALAVSLTLIVLAAAAAIFGQSPAPKFNSFIAVAATIWSFADLLTAFLLLIQFYINGRLLFALLSGAYTFSGLLTWAYLIAFPGFVNSTSTTVGDQQVSIVLWTIWHCTFPTIVLLALFQKNRLRNIVSRRVIRVSTILTVVTPVLLALAVATLVFTFRDALPVLSSRQHFAPLWGRAFVPAVLLINGIGCIAILRTPRLASLSLWLAVAMLATTLDGVLNLDTVRYSYAWDTGKLIAVFTASAVLVMILCDIAGLYGQLTQENRLDLLTGLPNLAAFEEHFRMVMHSARRLHNSMAVVMVDVDRPKRHREISGTAAGDARLQQIGYLLANAATRPLDFVCRAGENGFFIVLPDTPQKGVQTIADRVREELLKLNRADEGAWTATIGFSIGIGFTANAESITEERIYDAAKGALVKARNGGPNAVVIADVGAAEVVPDGALLLTGT